MRTRAVLDVKCEYYTMQLDSVTLASYGVESQCRHSIPGWRHSDSRTQTKVLTPGGLDGLLPPHPQWPDDVHTQVTLAAIDPSAWKLFEETK
jgi:hypothetical protein